MTPSKSLCQYLPYSSTYLAILREKTQQYPISNHKKCLQKHRFQSPTSGACLSHPINPAPKRLWMMIKHKRRQRPHIRAPPHIIYPSKTLPSFHYPTTKATLQLIPYSNPIPISHIVVTLSPFFLLILLYMTCLPSFQKRCLSYVHAHHS